MVQVHLTAEAFILQCSSHVSHLDQGTASTSSRNRSNRKISPVAFSISADLRDCLVNAAVTLSVICFDLICFEAEIHPNK